MRLSQLYEGMIDFQTLANRVWDFAHKPYEERGFASELARKDPNSYWKFLANMVNGINPPAKWNREPDWDSVEELAQRMQANTYDHTMYAKLAASKEW